MVAGPQADVVIAPGYDGRHARRAEEEAQEHAAPRGARARVRRTRDCRQISGGFLVQDAAALRGGARRLAGRHEGRADRRAVGRRRAGLADLRAREVELDRAGEGRPGRRHRRRAAEPGRGGRDRGEEGGRVARSAARARRTRSTRSPTASRPRRPRASRWWCSPVASMQRREGHRPRRRARPRDGVHRRTALPALMAADRMMPGAPGRGGGVRGPRAAHQGAASTRVTRSGSARSSSATTPRARATSASSRRRPRSSGSRRRTSTCRDDATQADVLAAIHDVQRRPGASTATSCSTRRRRRSTSTPRCSRSTPTRTSTACTR